MLEHGVSFLGGPPGPQRRKHGGWCAARVAERGTYWGRACSQERGVQLVSPNPCSVVRVRSHCTLTTSRTAATDRHFCVPRFSMFTSGASSRTEANALEQDLLLLPLRAITNKSSLIVCPEETDQPSKPGSVDDSLHHEHPNSCG